MSAFLQGLQRLDPATVDGFWRGVFSHGTLSDLAKAKMIAELDVTADEIDELERRYVS